MAWHETRAPFSRSSSNSLFDYASSSSSGGGYREQDGFSGQSCVGAYQKKAFRVRRACCVRVRFASERASDPFPARTHGVCRLPSTNPIPDRVLWKRNDITIWRQKRTYCMATDMAVTDEEEYNAQLFFKKKETNISLLL
jgi:hypothetical protein